jgi:asparagine synthase (glutamine-hydrolysing)
MCGIVGIHSLARGAAIDATLLARMNASIVHRGPDSAGSHVEPGKVGLAMRRLAIIDVAEGDQPLANEDDTVQVVFNGEIYNFRELRAELESKGHRFRTHADTEVLVHGYEEFGEGLLDRLRGMFAFALWDTRASRLLLARDRIGIKQLFYTEVEGQLLFASEIKALLKDPRVERRLSPAAVNLYFGFLYLPEPTTMFDGIHELEAGHLLVAEGGEVRQRRYWSLDYAVDPDMSLAEAARGLRERLDEAVRLRLVSDVPLGAFLSGGIDSGAVVALMARHSDAAVRTFSIGYSSGGDAFDERRYAREIAERYATAHREFVMQPDLVAILPELVRAFDQPCADSSCIANWYLCAETRRHVTVALSGLGGDEIAAGYERHRGAQLAERLGGAARWLLRLGLGPLVEAIPDARSGLQWTERAKRFLRSVDEPFDDRYFAFLAGTSNMLRGTLLAPDLLADPELREAGDPRRLYRRHLADVAGADPLNRALYADLKLYLPGNLLTLTDRMSMAHSLEVRVPFLDHRLVEFAATIPPEHKLFRGTRKHVLREAVRDLVPESFLRRRKMGFSLPLAVWFRGELRAWVEDTLCREAVERSGVLSWQGVRAVLDAHFDRSANFDDLIWALLSFVQWQQDVLQQPVARDGG